MEQCEVCQAPAECRCSGLDVPQLSFCHTHGEEHAAECLHILAGEAALVTIPSAAGVLED